MKRFIAILISLIFMLSSFSVSAATEGGYTHLSVGDAGNSKLFLPLGEYDTEYTKHIDYMAYAVTDNKTDLSDESPYSPQAILYSRDKTKEKNASIYLDDTNVWNVNGFDYILEPDSKVIKVFKHATVNLSDKELEKQVNESKTPTGDVQNGCYKNINILVAQPSSQPANMRVKLDYTDGTYSEVDVTVENTNDLDKVRSKGYIVTKAINGETGQAGRRFMGKIIECDSSKVLDKITYTCLGNWRHFYIISQMAENVQFSEIKKRTEGLIEGLSAIPEFYSTLNYIELKDMLEVLRIQYGKSVNELENYEKFATLSALYEERLASSSPYEIYVANNSANGNGSFESPFGSISVAKDFIGKAFKYGLKNAPVNVNIMGGEYVLDKSIAFTNENSGTEKAPITYKAYNNQEVIITTADKIPASAFKEIKDEKILDVLDTNIAKNVKQIDLNKLGIENPGQFLPNSEKSVREDVILVSKDRQLPVAQYPNGDMHMTMALSVIDAGEQRKDEFVHEGGGTVEITPQQAKKWEHIDSMESYVQGAFFEPWMFERILIEEISAENNSMKFYSGSYGPIKNSSWGGLRYKIMHALCELDIPGEWFIDRKTNILYYYPQENDEEIYISTKDFNAIHLNNVSFVNFEGLTFKNIRGNAIYAEKGFDDANIKDCVFKNVATNAIQVVEQKDSKAVGYNVDSSYNLNIENNMFISVGNYALTNNGSGHSGTLTYSGNTFKNNYLYDCANLSKKYMVNITNAVADKVENNLVHKSEMGGITFSGNDMFVAYNEVYNMGENAADVAGIYTGRSYVRTNNEIAYNYVYNSRPLFSQLYNHHRGIYLDDGTSGQYVHNNISNNVTYMSSASGKKNRVMNNIILGESKTPINLGVSEYLTDSQMLNPLERARDLNNYGEIWLEKYPWLADIDKWTYFNNEISGNVTQIEISYGEEWEMYNNPKTDIKNNIVLGYGNYEPFVDPENHDFRVKKDSYILETNPDVPNENNFSMDSIGLQGGIVSKIQAQLNKEDSAFDIIMPKRNSNISSTDRVFFMWQTAEHADEYDFKLYKANDLANPVYETTTGTNFVEINDLPFESAEYKWTVTAKVDSLKIRAQWESKVKYNSFKVTDITVNEDVYEYVDIKPYINGICCMYVGQEGMKTHENGKLVFHMDFVPNVDRLKSHLDENNMVKAGDVYYKFNQLDDKYKGIINFKEDIVIDIPDSKYEYIYLLGENRCGNLMKKNIKVKYIDGSEEELNLGQQVHYEEGSNADGKLMPIIFTGAIWVKNGKIRGDWFGGGLYSHKVKPSEDKIVTEIIIPGATTNGDAFHTYAITLKFKTDKYEIKNNTDEDIKTSVIEKFDEHYRISDIEVKANSSIYGLDKITSGAREIFVWNLNTLIPYTNVIKK